MLIKTFVPRPCAKCSSFKVCMQWTKFASIFVCGSECVIGDKENKTTGE